MNPWAFRHRAGKKDAKVHFDIQGAFVAPRAHWGLLGLWVGEKSNLKNYERKEMDENLGMRESENGSLESRR